MRQLILLTIAAIVLANSCIHEEYDDCTINTPVAFTGNMAQLQTRVGGSDGSEWEAGDPVGIYMIEAIPGTLSTPNVLTNNKRYLASAGKLATFSPFDGISIYYPNDGRAVKFVAYHPYSAALIADFKLPIDLTNQNYQSTIDVLYAPVTTASYSNSATTAVPLTFEHKLVKLVILITNAVGITTPLSGGVTVSIPNQQRFGALDLTNGVVTPSGERGALMVTGTGSGSGDSVVTEFTIFPGSTTGISISLTNSAGQIFAATVPHSSWDGGYIYTYNITLDVASAAITGAITKWGNGGSYQMDAENE